MKSNENETTPHLNGSFAVPFTMTKKTIMISNQDCFDGEWNALFDMKYHILHDFVTLFHIRKNLLIIRFKDLDKLKLLTNFDSSLTSFLGGVMNNVLKNVNSSFRCSRADIRLTSKFVWSFNL